MIILRAVRPEDRELFWNIHQKHLYEMTAYYPDDMDVRGNYHYGYFDAYFTDPARKAFFIFNDEKMVGFVMLNPYSAIGREPDCTIAEFAIFPAYRGRHYGFEAARQILSSRPGDWEIKYNEGNTGAKKLWTKVTAGYRPEVVHLNAQETVLAFTV